MALSFASTPTLIAAAAEAVELLAPNEAEALRHCAKAKTLSLAEVRQVSAVLLERRRAADSSTAGPSYVHELLAGAKPLLPATAERAAAHPELQPRLARLRAAQEGREYAAMVGDICGSEAQDKRDASEMATYRSQAGVGVNLIVSMVTMFCVGFYAGGTEEEPHGVRALFCGLALSILTMLVEITLFVIGASRVDKKMHEREEAAAGRTAARRALPTANADRTRLGESHCSGEARSQRGSLPKAKPPKARLRRTEVPSTEY